MLPLDDDAIIHVAPAKQRSSARADRSIYCS